MATAGGSLRQGQAYAVNGMRPEQNVYLVDGGAEPEPHGRRLRAAAARGRDCRVPHPHAERAARVRRHRRCHDQRGHKVGRQPILTAALYEFLRNDAFDARNFFSAEVEPLNQHQFGGTLGGPDRARPRCSSSATTRASATSRASPPRPRCPPRPERQGDFSEMGRPAAEHRRRRRAVSGQPHSAAGASTRSHAMCWTCTRSATSRRRSIARRWLAGTMLDQAGGRVDFNPSASDQLFARYSYSGGHNINPISVRGTDVPGFPTRDDIADALGRGVAPRASCPRRLTNSLRGDVPAPPASSSTSA